MTRNPFAEPAYIERGAGFSPDNEYRYRLWRVWDHALPRVAFLLLNPSTADANVLDQTLRRCCGFAQVWGFGGFEVVNLFALRSTKPTALYTHRDPVGPANDATILDVTLRCALTIAGWGVHGSFRERGETVRRMVTTANRELHVLALTKNGAPRHPLYLRGDLEPLVWRAGASG